MSLCSLPEPLAVVVLTPSQIEPLADAIDAEMALALAQGCDLIDYLTERERPDELRRVADEPREARP